MEQSEEVETINNWNNEIDNQLEKADIEVTKLENWISEKERADEIVAQEVRFDAERKMHEKRLEMHAEFTAKQSNSVIVTQSQECEEFTAKTAAKLPKLVISKFDGSYMNWPKFWGQFTEAIDKSSIAPITKFTYLLELLEPKAKRCVEALPFNPEGYNRAKAILVDKFGKESEIVKVYVKQILDLPNVPGTNPRVIADFYENLTHSVQALETMGKLSQIDGNVSMTLDKLSGIRGNFVRVDPDWEMWDFEG